jgi:hypothetical protein
MQYGFIKLGEWLEASRVEEFSSVAPIIDDFVVQEHFKKIAAGLKTIAPKAEDFLYFSAVMMHAAEASALNPDGTPKLTATGEPVKVGWIKDKGSWRWTTNDKSIRPYKNSNGDIFPEEELIKAHRKWVGKPLCVDHKSDSVDHVRGFIVDTYYDRNLKRVVALCALDKHNYPELARKVATGYSTCVSMGTAVGQAICSDCGQVARTEKDFCNHMRSKTCYGEINIDLSPIELSIVVNGADPQAKIKHIIAAANNLNNYVSLKEKELNKLSVNNNAYELINIRKDLDETITKLAKLEEIILEEKLQKDTNDLALNQTASTATMQETDVPSTDFNIAPPAQRLASKEKDALIKEFQAIATSLEAKVADMKKNLDKLSNNNILNKEEHMSESKDNLNKQAFYQGTEEPTPGQAKYTKDPLNEKLRTDGDKHMNLNPKDIGEVDEIFPGDLEKKKMLARAQAEERAMRRQYAISKAKEALEKKSWFQGGGGVNEPTPGKTKYTPDKMNEDLREKSDKQMVGKKPFPGVGDVDDMYPNDRKVKEPLKRASLRARFVKAANKDGTQNLGDSAWEVYLGDELLLTASVSDLSGQRAELLYDTIATKDFGSKLIEKIKVFGADKVAKMYKIAQDVAPGTAAQNVAPAQNAAPAQVTPPNPNVVPAKDAVQTPDATQTSSTDATTDAGSAKGDPKETVKDLMNKTVDVVSDLKESVDALIGEQSEMGDLGELGKSASDTNTALNKMRVELNGALIDAMKETIAELEDHHEELKMIYAMYDKGTISSSNDEFVKSIVEDAITDAKTSLADSFKLMSAFVKYARGTEAIVKRASLEADLNKLAESNMELEESDLDDLDRDNNGELMDMIESTDTDLSNLKKEVDYVDDSSSVDSSSSDSSSVDSSSYDSSSVDSSSSDSSSVDDSCDEQSADMVAVETPSGKKVTVPQGSKVSEASFDLQTKEGRALYRAKLASEMLETSPHLNEAHPKGGYTTDLDVKPSGDLAKVEDLNEQHDAMMDVATAPPKVRKEAEAIQQLIVEGKLDPNEVDALVAEGLDKDAVAYWKKFYGQVGSEGSEFAAELVKEHAKAKAQEEMEAYKVKLARAYELTYDMVDRGLCARDRSAITAQVNEIMKFNDEGFESLKRVVSRHNLVKEAGHVPQVGLIGSSESVAAKVESDNLFEQLNAAFSKSTKRLF